MRGNLIDAAVGAVRAATRDGEPAADFAIGVRLKVDKEGAAKATASVKGKGVTLAIEEEGFDADAAVEGLVGRLEQARAVVDGEMAA